MSGQCVRCGDIWPFKGPDFRPVTVVWQTLQQDDNDNDDDDGDDDDDDNNNHYNNNNMAARTHAHERTTDAPNRLFMKEVRLSVSLFSRQIYSV